MSNVVTLDHTFILHKLNTLPPKSRKREGYVDVLRQIRREELANDQIGKMLVDALDMMDLSDIQGDRIRESF